MSRARPSPWRMWLPGAVATAWLPLIVAGAARWTLGVRFGPAWWAVAYAGVVYVAWRVWTWLPDNRPLAGGPPFAALGWGNALSWLRGGLLALVAASALTGQGLRPPALAVTALVYTLAAALDLADGALARRQGQVSRLGQRLDLHLDGWGVFWASLAAVRSGQMPPWFLAVGLARPAYVLLGAAIRRLGRTPGNWRASPWRRWLAGTMMTFVAAALWPWWGPPLTTWVGCLISLPFLGHFALDMVDLLRGPGGARPTTSAGRPAPSSRAQG